MAPGKRWGKRTRAHKVRGVLAGAGVGGQTPTKTRDNLRQQRALTRRFSLRQPSALLLEQVQLAACGICLSAAASTSVSTFGRTMVAIELCTIWHEAAVKLLTRACAQTSLYRDQMRLQANSLTSQLSSASAFCKRRVGCAHCVRLCVPFSCVPFSRPYRPLRISPTPPPRLLPAPPTPQPQVQRAPRQRRL
jgi:hypothetical protein